MTEPEMTYQILQGDCMEVLKALESESVQTCVTSPPYFGLRDYGSESQIGLEETPALYVAKMVEVFGEVRRVLKKDGTLWLNLGDSYAGSGKGGQSDAKRSANWQPVYPKIGETAREAAKTKFSGEDRLAGLKAKDLIGIPWRVAFALQEAGWWLRQDIIWSKPNPMPESVTDRCTKAHEYIFLLTKSARYYYDNEAVREPMAMSSISRLSQDVENQVGSDRVPGKTNGNMKAVARGGVNAFRGQGHFRNGDNGPANREGRDMKEVGVGEDRNKRSVWTVTTRPFKEAHFATFPPKLIEPCILAGSHEGDLVLDPFNGAGTTGIVSLQHRRRYIGIELNPEYIAITEKRLRDVQVNLF